MPHSIDGKKMLFHGSKCWQSAFYQKFFISIYSIKVSQILEFSYQFIFNKLMISPPKAVLVFFACLWIVQMTHVSHQTMNQQHDQPIEKVRITSQVSRDLLIKQDPPGQITLQRSHGYSSQIWLRQKNRDGSQSLSNVGGLFITCPINPTLWARVELKPKTPGLSQKLRIEKVNGYTEIKCQENQYYSFHANGLTEGATIVLHYRQNSINQRWVFLNHIN